MTRYTLDDYLGRITPWQSPHPKFSGTVSGSLAPVVDATAVIAHLPADFDLDLAIGVQLDIVGQWVGRARTVRLPIAGIYFSFDDPLRGWDKGVWRGPYDTEYGITSLDDETYRRLLYAVILANAWDGTVPGAQAAFDTFFIDPATRVFLQDNGQVPMAAGYFTWDWTGQGYDQAEWSPYSGDTAPGGLVDVSMTICVSGRIPPPVYLGLLGQGAIPIKPGGVTTTYSVTSVDEAALFGFDVQSEFVSGFDTGAWGVSPEYLLANL